jgi:predicted phosphodiesterase
MKRILISIAGVVIALAAMARQPDGTLGLLQTPNNGIPAVALAGESFEAVLLQQAELRLADASGQRSAPLETVWKELPGGRFQARCVIPANATPGLYALEATANGQTDRTARAVCVRGEAPEYYVIAHVSDTHVNSGEKRESSVAMLKAVIDAINRSDAALVLITGDLTHGGQPDQFQTFLELLDTCVLPTFVCPGNHDRAGLNYEQFFGPLTYRFRFGLDGFLAFDTKDFITADDLGPQDTDLYLFRRELKPCRWTFGVTHRYEQMMGMRSQLILFVDDPLDFLLFGHIHRENTREESIVPWGTTRIHAVPAAINGAYRLIDVAVGGILLRPVQNATAPK